MSFINPWCTIAALVLCQSALASDPTRELLHQTIANYEQSQKRMADYLFDRRSDNRQLEANGSVREQTTIVVRRDLIEEVPIQRMIERNGKPLSEDELAKERAAVRKALDEHKALSSDEQRKRLEGLVGPQREMEFLKEMPDALDYRYVDSEWRDRREILHFVMSPRPGYKAKKMQARVFEKIRGDIWIEKRSAEIVKVDAEVFDNVSVGGFLAKVEKGTRFLLERILIEPENVWLMQRTRLRFATKIMLIKSIRQERESVFSNYRLVPKAEEN